MTRLLQAALQFGPPLAVAATSAALRYTLAHLLWRVLPASGACRPGAGFIAAQGPGMRDASNGGAVS